MSVELYPELIDYIFGYGGRFFTETELLANRHLFALAHSDNDVTGRRYKFYMKEINVYANEEAMDLANKGYPSFKEFVVKRICELHAAELNLNLCPACGKIARTPLAQQCRFCYHDWH